MVHAALLLLMLEAAQRGPRFTISLKRSTQKSSAIHKLVGRLPYLLMLWTAPPLLLNAMEVGTIILPEICAAHESLRGPSVWTGRALQAESDDLERLVLRFCIRPIDGAFELLAIMDIRACSISFASRPRRPKGPPDHERAGETFLHLLILTRRPWWEKPTQKLFWISALGRRLGDARFITALLSQRRPGDPCQLVGESGGQNVGMEALSGAREPDPEAVLRPACRP